MICQIAAGSNLHMEAPAKLNALWPQDDLVNEEPVEMKRKTECGGRSYSCKFLVNQTPCSSFLWQVCAICYIYYTITYINDQQCHGAWSWDHRYWRMCICMMWLDQLWSIITHVRCKILYFNLCYIWVLRTLSLLIIIVSRSYESLPPDHMLGRPFYVLCCIHV